MCFNSVKISFFKQQSISVKPNISINQITYVVYQPQLNGLQLITWKLREELFLCKKFDHRWPFDEIKYSLQFDHDFQ